MLRIRFHAPWLPTDHDKFWSSIDCITQVTTITDLFEHFNKQQKDLAIYYEWKLPKRATKIKYFKAFVGGCVLPPCALTSQILRDEDQVDLRLEIDAENEWLLVKTPPNLSEKRPREDDISSSPPEKKFACEENISSSPPEKKPTSELHDILQTIANESKPIEAAKSFSFCFGNKRGRPIPPRPPVMSAIKVNSLIPRQVATTSKRQ